jgi:8-oxo-dGTP pyrophosphatase MutT (NUDIX family)
MKDTTSPKAAVAVVFNSQGKVLAVQRKNSDKIGLPGGKVEGEESTEGTAKRETLEETGYQVFSKRFLGSEIDKDGFETTAYLCEMVGYDESKKKSGEAACFWVEPSELFGETGAYPEFNEKYVTLAWKFWDRIEHGRYYMLSGADQSIYIKDRIGHLTYGGAVYLSKESEWFMTMSVWSKIPFFLERQQILDMSPVPISYYEYTLDLESAELSRQLIGTNPTGWKLVAAAQAYAYEAHNLVNQRYAKKYLYSKHLKDVASQAIKFGPAYFEEGELCVMIALAYVHDVIEDCGVTYNDVKDALGERVANLAFALTNDKGKTRDERAGLAYYTGIIKEHGAKFGKLCDRIANVSNAGSMKSKYKKEFRSFQDKLRHEGEYDSMWQTIKDMFDEK